MFWLRWLGLPVFSALAILLCAGPAHSQRAPGNTPALSPPALPSTLPGGMPVPQLPPVAQQEILQRILNAAGGRGPLPSAPAAPATPAVPAQPPSWSAAPPPAAVPPEEPLSQLESFFAERLGLRLHQFGYDSVRAGPARKLS